MPAWSNLSTGVGDRNGTTTHTIGHSSAATAPSTNCALNFMPTAGTLLVVIVAASVTHTSSGTGAGSGWTKQQGPVNAAELGLFTKTAVGNDFLTLTHNTANYPMAWAVYAFPYGSRYTNSAGATANSDVFPLLGSLPGTPPQYVIAAFCGAMIAALVGSGSTCAAPWTEVFDSITIDGVTDGIYLYVFDQPAVTATSLTPTFTNGVSGGMPTNRQKIDIAVYAAPPPVFANEYLSVPIRRTSIY